MENLLVTEDLTRRRLSAMSAMSLDITRTSVQNFRRRIPRRSSIRRKVLWQHGMILNQNQNQTLKENKIDLSDLEKQKVTCLMSVSEEQWVWHRRLGHASLRKISQI